ncbi:MAG: sulfurtransferase [Burkholderiales bacterium]
MTFTTLISVAELAANLNDPGFVVFDCRHELTNPQFGTTAYAESHLPGARFAHLDRDLSSAPTGTNGRHPLPDPATFADWLETMGVSNDAQVIGYDSAGGVYAARLWWMLRWLGHDRVAVLDGGWDEWLQAGHPVTKEVPRPTRARFVANLRPVSVNVQQVLAHLNSPDMLIIDARSNDRFHGQNETIDPVGGHIPGARNRFFRDNLDASGRFKSPDRLRSDFSHATGGTPAGNVVHQCGSGVSACHNLLAMEIAGMQGSRLYPGSWSEWVAERSRPVAT